MHSLTHISRSREQPMLCAGISFPRFQQRVGGEQGDAWMGEFLQTNTDDLYMIDIDRP